MNRVNDWTRRVVGVASSHQVQYGILSLTYGAAEMQLCDKAMVGHVALLVYFILALRA